MQGAEDGVDPWLHMLSICAEYAVFGPVARNVHGSLLFGLRAGVASPSPRVPYLYVVE